MAGTLERELLPLARRRRPPRTPSVIQMEAVECGAASLAILLAHYGRVVPLTILRSECGVSRDGASAAGVLSAATTYGLDGGGRSMELDDLARLDHPVIIYWKFQHFVVVEGFSRRFASVRVHLNDPATGRRQVPVSEVDANFTGVVLDLQPGETFRQESREPSTWRKIQSWWVTSGRTFPLALLAGVVLALPILAIPLLSRFYFDAVYGRPGWQAIVPLVAGLALAVAATVVLTTVQLRSIAMMQARLGLTATTRFVDRLLHLPTRFYQQRFPAEVARRVRASDDVAELLGKESPKVISNAFLITVGAAALVWQDPLMGLLTTGIALLNFVVLRAVVRRRLDAAAALQASESTLAARTAQTVLTIENVKASGAEPVAFAQTSGALTRAISENQALGVPTALVNVVPPFLGTLNIAVVGALGGLRVMDGALSIGTLFAIQTLLAAFNRPVVELTGQATRLQMLDVQIDRLYDAEHYQIDPVYEQTGEVGRLTGALALEQVSFTHAGSRAPVVESVSLAVQPGRRLALVGASGSGKSTLGQLIAGLLQPTEGVVLIDGRDRRMWSRQTLAAQTAYVDQNVSLFFGSVRDNLALWDDEVSDEELTTALRDAEMLTEVMGRPGGLSALVAEEGSNFSGGQRQRLELARALAVNPALLILDEATSALDAETEYKIVDNLRQRGCAVVMIAHRLSTVRDADEIVVLSGGRIIERGTHDQLIARGGDYLQLVSAGRRGAAA